jgi:uncharacterized membrane protein YfcA
LATVLFPITADAFDRRIQDAHNNLDGKGHLAPDPLPNTLPEALPEVAKAAVTFTARFAKPADDRHPFWVFEWGQIVSWEVLQCSFVLFFAGLLCSAGGIGGGGVYVTVLMVAGRLSPRDAVPLSKAIVFVGSLSSLALNLGRKVTSKSGEKELINVSVCRLVVPAALLGTLFGVVINRNAKDLYILLLLVGILLSMTVLVLRMTWTQYCLDTSGEGMPPTASGRCSTSRAVWSGMHKRDLRVADKYGGLCLLSLVVACGVVRHHASACLWELERGASLAMRQAACQHPTLAFFVGDRLEGWMGHSWGPCLAMMLTLLVPIVACSLSVASSSVTCIVHEGWSLAEVAKYETMAVLTGCLAGLVGIGGGLIFSPFLLIMGVDPATAVATSSTCVLFTSSSTTLQYLLTDRIIMAAAVAYGFINLIASYLGTALVIYLQDRFTAKRWYITAIVAAGVLLSACLTLAKVCNVALTTA